MDIVLDAVDECLRYKWVSYRVFCFIGFYLEPASLISLGHRHCAMAGQTGGQKYRLSSRSIAMWRLKAPPYAVGGG